MKPRTLAILAAPTLGLVFLQLVVGITVPIAGLFCGILISLIAFGLFRFFEVEFTSLWWPTVLPAAMSLLGILILGIVGMALSAILERIERRVVHWRGRG